MNNDFRRLLMSFERMLPLAEPSNLKQMDIAQKLHFMSEGLLGELSTLLTEAAVLAVRSGTEKIDLSVLDEVDYLSPTQRNEEKRW